MRTVFEEEEEIAPSGPQRDRELTISSTTLLAIFFGLVLICGLFFGLGYTLGRRSSSETSQIPASAAVPQPFDSQPKPSAAPQPALKAVSSAPPDQATDPALADSSTSGADSVTATAQPAQTQPVPSQPQPAESASTAPQPAKPLAPAAPQAAATATTPSVTPAQSFVVQIAAISNPADADVLVSALQKRGYSVAARHVATDSLIHVQVGPFTNRADAIAMRQKLLGDGYNAILK